MTRIDEEALERVSSQGGGVEPGRQQGFDLGERLCLGQFGEHVAQVGVGFECVGRRHLLNRDPCPTDGVHFYITKVEYLRLVREPG